MTCRGTRVTRSIARVDINFAEVGCNMTHRATPHRPRRRRCELSKHTDRAPRTQLPAPRLPHTMAPLHHGRFPVELPPPPLHQHPTCTPSPVAPAVHHAPCQPAPGHDVHHRCGHEHIAPNLLASCPGTPVGLTVYEYVPVWLPVYVSVPVPVPVLVVVPPPRPEPAHTNGRGPPPHLRGCRRSLAPRPRAHAPARRRPRHRSSRRRAMPPGEQERVFRSKGGGGASSGQSRSLWW